MDLVVKGSGEAVFSTACTGTGFSRFIFHFTGIVLVTVLCKSNESEIRRNTSFVLTNFQGNFKRYFAIFLRKFEELSKKCCVVDRKFGKANEMSMKRSFKRAKYRRIFEEAKRNMEEFSKKRKETWKFHDVR